MHQGWHFTLRLPRNLAEGEEEFFLFLGLKIVFWIGISFGLSFAKTMDTAGSGGDVEGTVF